MRAKLLVLILILVLVTITSAQPVTWEPMLSAQPFSWAACGILANYFYTWGGDFSIPFGQAFNLATREWTMIPQAPNVWGMAAAATTDSAIYLIGYYLSLEPGQVQKFTPDPATGGPLGTWTQLEHYPIPIYAAAAAWDGGNYIYVAGGSSDAAGTVHNLAYRYNIAGDAWTPLPNMPIATGWCGGAFVQGKFYVVGGWYQGTLLQEWDPDAYQWTLKTPPTVPVNTAAFATTTNGNLLFTVGGVLRVH